VTRLFSSFLLLALAAGAQQPHPSPIAFDDSAPDRIVISAPAYTLALAKSNGAILSLRDNAAGASLTLGSRNGCLWGATFQTTPQTYRGGCDASTFHYSWDARKHVLTLTYRDAPSANHRADVTVTLSAAEDFFDLQLNLDNRMGAILDSVPFPSDLVFDAASIRAAYLPYFQPGVRLEPSFFTSHRSISATYPGTRAFADHLALESGGGRLAWYVVNPSGRIAPVMLGFRDDNAKRAGTFYALHSFQTWTPDGARFSTPPVRVRIGQTVERTILAYRAENSIDRYPSIESKLGPAFAAVAQSPLVKMGFGGKLPTFAEAAAKLSIIEPPALLHPVSYWPRAFDQNYPDFLPPNERYGTTADFRAFVNAAHQRGMFVMPYTNPTWWDDQSPTAKSVADLKVFAALSKDGKPILESYGPNHGFVASPSAPATQQRLDRLMTSWKEDVPVDFVFQDQVGSRGWLRDFQPSADNQTSNTPQDYSDAWLAFTAKYASSRLMTEDGWDRLAATETGFCGSELTGAPAWDPHTVRWGAGNRADKAFGSGNWRPYPLGDWLFHDKVLFYHHDLAHPPMNAGIEVLTWNAAFGVMAGYLWPDLGGLNPDWIKLANAYQRAVFSKTAGRTLSSYRELAPEVNESRFGDLTAIANWNATDAYETGAVKLAPSGFFARTDDGSLLAGAFVDRFNGAPLSAGVHYLIVERTAQALTIRQPVGEDTEIRIAIPGKGVKLLADGKPADFRIDGQWLTFLCSAKVTRYEITSR
jgi:hypothetical protein